jgi:cytochrome oxidase Cu insertion factor (SCO1/SenC/PrrC family)
MRRRTVLICLWLLTLTLPQAGLWAQNQKKAAPPPPPEPKFKVGDMAPDFTLLDTKTNKVQLSSFRGKKNVVLAFYIFAFTGG